MHARFFFSFVVNVAVKTTSFHLEDQNIDYINSYAIFYHSLTYVYIRTMSKRSRIPYSTYTIYICVASKNCIQFVVDLISCSSVRFHIRKIVHKFIVNSIFSPVDQCETFLFSFLVGMQEGAKRFRFGWWMIWFHFFYFKFSSFCQFLVSTQHFR